MKYLITPFICSASIIISVSILGFTVSTNSSAVSTPESQINSPVKPAADLYTCMAFPFCGDPDDASPIKMQDTQLDSKQLSKQV